MNTEPCTCGNNEWETSATLISCVSCKRTWGRVNGAWVFDYLSAPLGETISVDKFSVLGYHNRRGEAYMCSWVGGGELKDVVVTWPGHDLDEHIRKIGLIHASHGLQPGMILRRIPRDVPRYAHVEYAAHHGGVHAFG